MPHIPFENTFQGYSAYVREMNLWGKQVSEMAIVAPLKKEMPTAIHSPYHHKKIKLYAIPQMAFTSIGNSFKTFINLPFIVFQMLRAMRKADHIHLRCPGTIGLVGCVLQILFPKKQKTAKYAGNWDPNAQQPLSYQLQKKILSNTFLTRNMKVLVYGEWEKQSQNIVPFFTATYRNDKRHDVLEKDFTAPFKALFVGTLSPGKRPLYAIRLIERLRNAGIDITLDVYGDGIEREAMLRYCAAHHLEDFVVLHGNQTAAIVEEAYKNHHFMLLPSQSEGWPKVVAEAMFWGCIPWATQISCLDWMLAGGQRGLMLNVELEKDVNQIITLLEAPDRLQSISMDGQLWSQQYTLDTFEAAIEKYLN